MTNSGNEATSGLFSSHTGTVVEELNAFHLCVHRHLPVRDNFTAIKTYVE
jgi:hypothetical protein